jgi:hypothetical protein
MAINRNYSVWRNFRTWRKLISRIAPTKPILIQWFNPQNSIRRSRLGYAISPRATTARTTTNPRRSTPSFLFSSSWRSMPVWPSHLSDLWWTCCGLHEQWGEQEIKGKTRKMKCCLTSMNDDGGRQQRQRMTAVANDGSKTLNPSLSSSISLAWTEGGWLKVGHPEKTRRGLVGHAHVLCLCVSSLNVVL